jgi:cell wall assembly regulator SMI1
MNVPGFDPSARGASTEDIAAAERLLGVRFPAEYAALLTTHAGAYGDADFTFPGSAARGSIGLWLGLSPWDRESIWTTLSTWTAEHEMPRTVVPVAADGGGNCLCLDYRSSHDPSVAFWFHELLGEEGLSDVAPSFRAFLGMLREP